MLDEADEMLDMGFAEDLEAIFAALPEKRQTALFSATLPPKIAKIAENHLHDAFHILIPKEKVPEGEQPKVKQSAYIVGRNHKTAALGRILDIESPRLAIVSHVRETRLMNLRNPSAEEATVSSPFTAA